MEGAGGLLALMGCLPELLGPVGVLLLLLAAVPVGVYLLCQGQWLVGGLLLGGAALFTAALLLARRNSE